MYVPRDSQMPAKDTALDFIERYGFAVLVSSGLEATHVPLCLDRDRCVLIGHMARANPHWRSLEAAPVLAIFHGPHAYISPTWYGRVPAVPTWNYSAVHVRGVARLLDQVETIEAIHQLVRQYEPDLLERRDVLTDDISARLINAVAGFEIRIDDLQGSFKLGQEKPEPEQRAVVAGLENSGSPEAEMLLRFMRDQALGTGED